MTVDEVVDKWVGIHMRARDAWFHSESGSVGDLGVDQRFLAANVTAE
jgi:hypothetical protein